jgi:pimeloyl-ACP methyl ester carboxylesterase
MPDLPGMIAARSTEQARSTKAFLECGNALPHSKKDVCPEDTVNLPFQVASADQRSNKRPWHRFWLAFLCAALFIAPMLIHAAPKLPLIPLPSFQKKPAKPEPKEPDKPETPETRFVQVFPEQKDRGRFARSQGQKRAVVLLHGYRLCFKKISVPRAILRDWEEKGSPLVNALGQHADVFAFAYGQTVPVEAIDRLAGLREGIARVKKLGYSRIVLVGHSAGGLVARCFVEDYPEAGVTKVVQVCAPNGGSYYADLKFVPKNHKLFVKSLSKASREKCLLAREGKKIPAKIQFVCIVTAEDMVVPCKCQWTLDLQKQGVPVLKFVTGHRQVMRKTASAKKIAEVICANYPRWQPGQVAEAVKEIFKPKKVEIESK